MSEIHSNHRLILIIGLWINYVWSKYLIRLCPQLVALRLTCVAHKQLLLQLPNIASSEQIGASSPYRTMIHVIEMFCFSSQGFYLGNRIKVITKKEECPYVTEITISKVSLIINKFFTQSNITRFNRTTSFSLRKFIFTVIPLCPPFTTTSRKPLQRLTVL